MSALAHAALGTPHMSAEKKAQTSQAQAEIKEAKHLQDQLKCSWTEALRLAYKGETA